MQIIPVIDLMGGQVVHARHGNRAQYAPIESPLCQGSDPCVVIQSLLAVYPFKALYIADLDGIQGKGHHQHTIQEITENFPELVLWLDGGASTLSAPYALHSEQIRLVVGSESVVSIAEYQSMTTTLNSPILSLDYKDGHFLGPVELLDQRHWPNDVIAMSLNFVGSQRGPDFSLLHALRKQSLTNHIYAAGGVRNHSDLSQLSALNINGALIATAIHSGLLTGAEIASLDN